MKMVMLLFTGILVITILSTALGEIQSGLAVDYPDVTYNKTHYEFDNATAEVQLIAENIQEDIRITSQDDSTLSDKASAILGATMDTGKLVIRAPGVMTSFFATIGMRTGFPISSTILGLVTLIMLVAVVFGILMWRRGIG